MSSSGKALRKEPHNPPTNDPTVCPGTRWSGSFQGYLYNNKLLLFRGGRICCTVPGHQFQRLAAQQSRDNRHLALNRKRLAPFPSTPEGAPTPALGERSGAPSGLRPSSFVICNTPVEVQFTSAGCLNYPCRTPGAQSDSKFNSLQRNSLRNGTGNF